MKLEDVPNHRTESFNGAFAGEHLPNSLWDRATKTVRVIDHLVVFVVALGIQFLEFLDRILVFQTFAIAEARPQAVSRKDRLQKTSGRYRKIALRDPE